MTDKEASSIIQLMKTGLVYGKEDNVDNTMEYWKYDSKEEIFTYEKYDMVAGGFLEEQKLNEKEFISVLVKNFSYDDFIGETF